MLNFGNNGDFEVMGGIEGVEDDIVVVDREVNWMWGGSGYMIEFSSDL